MSYEETIARLLDVDNSAAISVKDYILLHITNMRYSTINPVHLQVRKGSRANFLKYLLAAASPISIAFVLKKDKMRGQSFEKLLDNLVCLLQCVYLHVCI